MRSYQADEQNLKSNKCAQAPPWPSQQLRSAPEGEVHLPSHPQHRRRGGPLPPDRRPSKGCSPHGPRASCQNPCGSRGSDGGKVRGGPSGLRPHCSCAGLQTPLPPLRSPEPGCGEPRTQPRTRGLGPGEPRTQLRTRGLGPGEPRMQVRLYKAHSAASGVTTHGVWILPRGFLSRRAAANSRPAGPKVGSGPQTRGRCTREGAGAHLRPRPGSRSLPAIWREAGMATLQPENPQLHSGVSSPSTPEAP